MSDPIDAAEAARKAAETAQRRSWRAARTVEQRAAERAANTAARSAARAAAAHEHAAADQPLRDLTNRQVFESPSKIDAQNIIWNCTCLCRGVSDPEDAAEAARTATRTAQRRTQRAERTAEQQAAERAANTAARSVARAAIHRAANARQATPHHSHFPVHPRHRVAQLETAGMFLNLLTSPFVYSQPL